MRTYTNAKSMPKATEEQQIKFSEISGTYFLRGPNFKKSGKKHIFEEKCLILCAKTQKISTLT